MSTLGYAEYRALWADAGERFDAEADRTGREFSMRDLGARSALWPAVGMGNAQHQ